MDEAPAARRFRPGLVRPASPRAAAAVAAAGVVVLVVSALVPPSRTFSERPQGDIKEYYRYVEHTLDGQVPYRDFLLVYPPGLLPVVLAAGPADKGYYNRFRVLMLGLGSAVVCLLVAALYLVGARVTELCTGVLLLATLPLTLHPQLVFERFDLWPAALVLVAVIALLKERRVLALAALGVGAVAKLYPVVVVPLAVLAPHGRARTRRDLSVFAVAVLAFALPFMVVAPRGVGHVGKLLVERALHVESLGGSILLAGHRLGPYEPTIHLGVAGSWDLFGPAAKIVAVVGTVAEMAALLAVWFLFARGPRDPASSFSRSPPRSSGSSSSGRCSLRSTSSGWPRRCRSRSDVSGGSLWARRSRRSC